MSSETPASQGKIRVWEEQVADQNPWSLVCGVTVRLCNAEALGDMGYKKLIEAGQCQATDELTSKRNLR